MTAYAVAKASRGRINVSTIYRLTRNHGRLKMFSGDLLEALAEVFGVSDASALLELERSPHPRTPQRRGKRGWR